MGVGICKSPNLHNISILMMQFDCSKWQNMDPDQLKWMWFDPYSTTKVWTVQLCLDTAVLDLNPWLHAITQCHEFFLSVVEYYAIITSSDQTFSMFSQNNYLMLLSKFNLRWSWIFFTKDHTNENKQFHLRIPKLIT